MDPENALLSISRVGLLKALSGLLPPLTTLINLIRSIMKTSLMTFALTGLAFFLSPASGRPGGEIDGVTSLVGGVVAIPTTVSPRTWASTANNFGTNSRYTAPTAVGAQYTGPAYTTITTNGGWMRLTLSNNSPVATKAIATSAAMPETSSSSGPKHLALAVALPITLLVACVMLVALLLYRRRAANAARQRRANSWAARMPWVSDQKTFTDDFAQPPTPLSPLAPTHQRKTSIV